MLHAYAIIGVKAYNRYCGYPQSKNHISQIVHVPLVVYGPRGVSPYEKPVELEGKNRLPCPGS
ncbi:MAG: hypothetical protein K0R08_1109 [Solimicrobium sp.]|jgi:hypothetical protein|nr:hypothetical protein [Solimicrobium sp.]